MEKMVERYNQKRKSKTVPMVGWIAFVAVWLVVMDKATVLAFSAVAPLKSPKVTESTRTPLSDAEAKLRREEQERIGKANHNNFVFNALFEPVEERPEPAPCSIPGDIEALYGSRCKSELPTDFPNGALMRIGPNSFELGEGFLDGDGMIHCITFPPAGQIPMYSATYVQTEGRETEEKLATDTSKPKYRGTLGGAPNGYPLLGSLVQNGLTFRTFRVQKDTCNTAIGESGGRLLALMEQGLPSEFTVSQSGRIRTVQNGARLDGGIPNDNPLTGGSFTAHGKTCPDTNEQICVSYNANLPPWGRMDVFDAGWQLKRSVPVNMPSCVMLHDSAITENYDVVLDLPLTIRPERIILKNDFPVEYEPENGARIGLVPRHGQSKDTMWFDVDVAVVLHTVNAFEKDGKVVLHGHKSIPNTESSYILSYTPAFLYEWELDLETRKVNERWLNSDTMVEFPSVTDDRVGKEAPHCYAMHVNTIGGPLKRHNTPREGITFFGYVKQALVDTDEYQKGDVIGKYHLPADWYPVSEPTVVTNDGKEYVLGIATHATEESDRQLRSHVFVLDGDDMDAGPVSAFELPHCVPYGLHSHFTPWSTLKEDNV